MDNEKVELSENAVSYALEIDLEDLSTDETLESRYERYISPEDTVQNQKSDHSES